MARQSSLTREGRLHLNWLGDEPTPENHWFEVAYFRLHPGLTRLRVLLPDTGWVTGTFIHRPGGEPTLYWREGDIDLLAWLRPGIRCQVL